MMLVEARRAEYRHGQPDVMERTTACYEFVKHSKRAVEILQQVIATAEERFVCQHSGRSSCLGHRDPWSPWDFHSIATLPGGNAKSMDRS